MSKRLMLAAVLLAALLVACGGQAASPTAAPPAVPTEEPTQPPSAAPTAAPTVQATTVTSGTLQSSGPAVCTLEPMEFPANPNIPPITDEDHTHGPADAAITFVEYADFQ